VAPLIAGGLGFAIKTFLRGRADDAPFHLARRDKILAVVIGSLGGLVVGLTSVGSGTFFGLSMLLVYPLTARKIVGTDMLHASMLLWVAGAGHLIQGQRQPARDGLADRRLDPRRAARLADVGQGAGAGAAARFRLHPRAFRGSSWSISPGRPRSSRSASGSGSWRSLSGVRSSCACGWLRHPTRTTGRGRSWPAARRFICRSRDRNHSNE